MTDIAQTDPKLAELAKRRALTALSYNQTLVSSQTCPITKGGVVIVRDKRSHEVGAFFFAPTAINRYFKNTILKSAHEQLAALETLRTLLAEKKAAKVAPHTVKTGDIMVEISSYTIQRATFYQVVDVPSPRTVALARLDHRYVSGDWMSGSVEPIFPANPQDLQDQKPLVYKVSMETGEPCVRINSITRIRPWKGKPVQVYSD